jgi:alginate O-acetyltransferase complex protein AlgI
MVFSSSLFLLAFLPIFLLIYLVIPYKWKNYWALTASVAFYAWGAPKFIFVLFASTLIDFSFIKYGFNSKHSKKIFWISILLNVALLCYFKYANFFVENFNQALLSLGFESVSWTRVALPIGISFFTFQKISYLVDVYRKVQQPLKKFSDHLLYVILFPQLIAGPIVRYNEIAQEITDRKDQMNPNNRLLGLFRFAIGLGKKVIIANVSST